MNRSALLSVRPSSSARRQSWSVDRDKNLGTLYVDGEPVAEVSDLSWTVDVCVLYPETSRRLGLFGDDE